jgi:hypothetical protein
MVDSDSTLIVPRKTAPSCQFFSENPGGEGGIVRIFQDKQQTATDADCASTEVHKDLIDSANGRGKNIAQMIFDRFGEW